MGSQENHQRQRQRSQQGHRQSKVANRLSVPLESQCIQSKERQREYRSHGESGGPWIVSQHAFSIPDAFRRAIQLLATFVSDSTRKRIPKKNSNRRRVIH